MVSLVYGTNWLAGIITSWFVILKQCEFDWNWSESLVGQIQVVDVKKKTYLSDIESAQIEPFNSCSLFGTAMNSSARRCLTRSHNYCRATISLHCVLLRLV